MALLKIDTVHIKLRELKVTFPQVLEQCLFKVSIVLMLTCT